MKTERIRVKNHQDRNFYIICYMVIILLTLIVLYPVIYIISASISNAGMVVQGKVWLWPIDIDMAAYRMIFSNDRVGRGYLNTIIYTLAGTLINITLTLLCAYPMARKNLRGRSAIMFFFSFTMLFEGGMIPNYILIRNLGLLDSRWSILLPGAMSVYNMIVCRTFIQSNIPDEMLESAQIDGCSDFQFFLKMVLPLSKTVIAVLALWYGVGHWNAYFNAFLYLQDTDKYPLQIFLREILVQAQRMSGSSEEMSEMAQTTQNLYATIKYAIIVVATAPLMCVYPFVQKHFQKGVLIGSIKG